LKAPLTDELSMNPLLKEISHNPLLWLLAFVPAVLAGAQLKPEAHTLLFVLSVLASAVMKRHAHALEPTRFPTPTRASPQWFWATV
jgi:hypothetical protein